LRDHHAASAGGVALARRGLGASHPLTQQIARDRKTLEHVMRQLDVPTSASKVALVRVVERLGRLKLNGRLFARSPLSNILELEMLLVGIRAKEALWTALRAGDVRARGVDLDALIESAGRQARRVDEQRLRHAAQTFSRSAERTGISAARVGRRTKLRGRLALFGVLIVFMAGCGGEEERAETTQIPGEIAFDLSSTGDTGVAGVRAKLVYKDRNRTTVIVDGLDEGEPGGGGRNPARLYRGSCDDLGRVVQRLRPIEGSTSTTTVRLGVAALLDGEYAVAVALTGSADDFLACGDVPDNAPND
jgi:hypothetical protein